ncbi:MAG TPA: acyltransferase [Coriobacteriia bacterium]|nr:acyltransferase [Coriobacteriia bacterium]
MSTPWAASAARRNQLIDALRFVAIAMVVLTHVLNLRPEFKELAPWLVRAMMAFNMPLFAFVSGYVLLGREGHSALRFVRGKALVLLVPYFAWITLEMPLRGVPIGDWPARLAWAAIDPRAGFQMWFLLVLFYAFVVFAVARSISTSTGFTATTGIVLAALPLLSLPDSNLLSRLCWLYPFVVLGYLSARYRGPLRKWDAAIALVGFIAYPLLLTSGWDGVAYRMAVGASGTVALWAAFRLVSANTLFPLGWLGQRTMGVYGWQMVILPFLIVGAGWWGATLSWILVTTVAVLLTLALERTSFTRAVFLGRWPKPSVRAV